MVIQNTPILTNCSLYHVPPKDKNSVKIIHMFSTKFTNWHAVLFNNHGRKCKYVYVS